MANLDITLSGRRGDGKGRREDEQRGVGKVRRLKKVEGNGGGDE